MNRIQSRIQSLPVADALVENNRTAYQAKVSASGYLPDHIYFLIIILMSWSFEMLHYY